MSGQSCHDASENTINSDLFFLCLDIDSVRVTRAKGQKVEIEVVNGLSRERTHSALRADRQLYAGHLLRDKIEQATKHSLVPPLRRMFH